MRKLLSAAVLVAFAAAAPAAGPIADGNWLLTTVSPTAELAQAIVKVETKGGAPTASVVATPFRATRGGTPPKTEIAHFKATEKEVSFTLRVGDIETSFAGIVGTDAKAILGNYGADQFFSRAKLSATDQDKLERASNTIPVKDVGAEAFAKLSQLQLKSSRLQNQARSEKDEEKKAELLKEATAAAKEVTTAAPKIYREVVAEHGNSPAALDAAMNLVRSAKIAKSTPAEVAEWVKVIENRAVMYGPRYSGPALLQVADTLAADKAFSPVALQVVEPIIKGFTDSDKAAYQSKVLTTYRTILESMGKTAELPALDERIAKLEIRVDQEYLASVPPFKPEPYAGRKEASANKVVVMELFTGAQCPPCVAADVAFDALEKSYKHTDLLLLQYHMHIPGPDPLTNLDTIARWDYYRAKFPEGIRGTPSTVFNGKPEAGGGGGMTNARSKYNQYKGIINDLLEKSSDVKVAGTFGRAGDKLTATVTVSGADPSAELKLRLVVVEEAIKYVGSNQLRFHHEVVRSVLGGKDGITVNDKSFKKSLIADVGDVKKDLTKYLDEYAIKTRPFPFKPRPMDLTHLKVIALVQDDKTLEILQAAQLELGGEKTSITVDQK